ncbi:DUF5753 domain-containing protein [Umezawaea beigongshangensis]|uniref:DUF5753 domain-containing protein n=1 Tax=Umezawaea beigongshangensis TaxID=2780383 RepID=UPI0018F177B2|nr:DUF5753 domain-containing protein [Umezawaea beigongshangensis]
MREPKRRVTTVQSRELGEELRRARERARVGGSAVCEELEWSPAKLSKLEGGWRGTSDVELAVLLGRLGSDKATRDRVLRLAREHDTGYLVRPHFGKLADSLLCLIIHERAARAISSYEPMIVPGLLQTEDYAAAMIGKFGEATQENVDLKVRARIDRQEILASERSPVTEFFIHETALRTAVGGAKVMHDQMMRLAFMCDWRLLTPRVIPMAAGNHPYLMHSSVLMEFDSVKPVAYSETDTATVFLEDDHAVDFYQRKQSVLADLALDAGRSRSVFAHWADVYDRRGDSDDQDVAHQQLQRGW